MKAIFITLFSITLCTSALKGQGDESSYRAYLQSIDKTIWKKDVESKSKTPSDNLGGRLTLAMSHLGLLSATMADQDEDLFDSYYDLAVENLESLIKADKNWAEPKALLSAIYGLKMGYSPMMGMFLGPKSGSLIDKAKSLAPQSPLVWKMYANSKFFTPQMFGGDLEEAIKAYEKSVQLYESNPDQLKYNWLYLDTLAFMGQAYAKNGDKEKAKNVYEKALVAEPEFDWVKYSLLPKVK